MPCGCLQTVEENNVRELMSDESRAILRMIIKIQLFRLSYRIKQFKQ